MGWGESGGGMMQYNDLGQPIGVAGGTPTYTPDSIDQWMVTPEGDAWRGDPSNPAHVQAAAHALLMGAGMQPGSYNSGAGIGYGAIDQLYASDPRFAQFFPDRNAIYSDVQSQMNRQAGIDAAASSGSFMDNLLDARNPLKAFIMAAMAANGMPGMGAESMFGDAAAEAAMLGGPAVGAAGSMQLSPFAGIAGADPIETMINAANTTGAETWTDAARKLGFASPEAFLSSINPSWVNALPDMSGGGAPGDMATAAGTGTPFTWPGLSPSSLAINPNLAVTDTLSNAASGVLSNPVNIGGFPGGAAAGGAATDFSLQDWWKKLMAQMANDPMKAIQAGGGVLSTGMNLMSGILGMSRANQIPRQVGGLMSRMDPFGPHRAQYAQQLSQLAANPASVMGMPGYTFARDQGEQALTRKMAQGGYSGSGNEMIALKQFNEKLAGDWYNNEMNRLATLAGAGISPSGVGSLGMSGINASNDLMSRALASIGYGLRGA